MSGVDRAPGTRPKTPNSASQPLAAFLGHVCHQTSGRPRPGPKSGLSAEGLASRLGKFLVVGCIGLIVNNAALYAFYQLLRLPLILASTLATSLAIGNNFVLNDRWTFNGRRDAALARAFIRFGLVSLGGLAITAFTLWALVTYLNLHYLVANLIGIGLSTGSNFAANSTWTWSRSRPR